MTNNSENTNFYLYKGPGDDWKRHDNITIYYGSTHDQNQMLFQSDKKLSKLRWNNHCINNEGTK